MLEVDCPTTSSVTDLTHIVRNWGDPRDHKLYNVNFSGEFRYCLETGSDPAPEHSPTTLTLSISEKQANDPGISPFVIDEAIFNGDDLDIVESIFSQLEDIDPDVLIVSAPRIACESTLYVSITIPSYLMPSLKDTNYGAFTFILSDIGSCDNG